MVAEGRIYLLSEAGKLAVIKAGRDWHPLRVIDLKEKCYATPALVDGMILVRSAVSLWAFKGGSIGP